MTTIARDAAEAAAMARHCEAKQRERESESVLAGEWKIELIAKRAPSLSHFSANLTRFSSHSIWLEEHFYAATSSLIGQSVVRFQLTDRAGRRQLESWLLSLSPLFNLPFLSSSTLKLPLPLLSHSKTAPKGKCIFDIFFGKFSTFKQQSAISYKQPLPLLSQILTDWFSVVCRKLDWLCTFCISCCCCCCNSYSIWRHFSLDSRSNKFDEDEEEAFVRKRQDA